MNITNRVVASAAVAVISMMFASDAVAKTCVWTGKGTPNPGASNNLIWTDSGNWEDGNIPQSGDTVVMVPTSTTTIRPYASFTLENFYFTNTIGTTFNGNYKDVITITGTNSVIYADNKQFSQLQPIKVEAGAKLTYYCTVKNETATGSTSGSVCVKENFRLLGTGEIVKEGGGDINFFTSSSDFAGKFIVKKGQAKFMATVTDPMGGKDSEIHFYVSPDDRYGCTFNGPIFFHSGSTGVGYATYRTTTFNGDITFTAENKAFSPYLQASHGAKYYSATSKPGYVINGRFICDNSKYNVTPQFYSSYDCVDYFAVLNCEFVGWKGPLYLSQRGADKSDAGTSAVTLYLNKPFTTTSTTAIALQTNDRIVCGAKDVLKDIPITFGIKNGTATGAVLDLNGFDQHCGNVGAYQGNAATTIISTNAPATLFATVPEGTLRNVPVLKGHVSMRLLEGTTSQSDTTAIRMYGADTDGWISLGYGRLNLCDYTLTKLGGIELNGYTDALINGTSFATSDYSFDLRSCTRGIMIPTGVECTCKSVTVDGSQIAAGTYCCAYTNLGTKAKWMPGASTGDWSGPLTVSEQETAELWTGAAGDGDLANDENWSDGSAPDLTDSTVTVDLRRAAFNTIALSGNFTPSATILHGGFPGYSPTFSGTGSLVLSGTGAVTNDFVFTESAGLVWNGAGTLALKSSSTSAGILAVNAGKVQFLNDDCWAGRVNLASGAKLNLNENVAAEVASLYRNGTLVKGNRLYGSTSSAATIKDDNYFEGAGTVKSLLKRGIITIFR